jgi:hypothetical protein
MRLRVIIGKSAGRTAINREPILDGFSFRLHVIGPLYVREA